MHDVKHKVKHELRVRNKRDEVLATVVFFFNRRSTVTQNSNIKRKLMGMNFWFFIFFYDLKMNECHNKTLDSTQLTFSFLYIIELL